MNLAELQAQVVVLTSRPDLTDMTLQAVLASTQRMHCMDFFFRDIQTAALTFPTSSFIQSIDTSTLPRYRDLSYLRKNDPVATNVPSDLGFIDIIAPDDILDSYKHEKVDIGYQAGDSIFLRSSTAVQNMLIGYYAFPDLNVASFTSWIARDYPYAIVYDATAKIFQSMGQQDHSRKYDDPKGGLVQQQIVMLLNANITAKGR